MGILRSPTNFSWLLKNKLAGSARPTDESELSWLWAQGIRAIVCLNKEKPLDRGLVEDLGFRYKFIPIRDFSAPSVMDMNEYVKFVNVMIAQRNPVLTCCEGGKGRTGTMLAVYLVDMGCSPEEALEEVRMKRRGSVEEEEQEEAIRKYAKCLKPT